MRTAAAIAITLLLIINNTPCHGSSVLRSLKSIFTKPNCQRYLLSPDYERLLSTQLEMSRAVKGAVPEWQGGPEFTADEIRTAAKEMHRVNTDPSHRRLIVNRHNTIYISFKFFMPKRRDRDTLLTSRLAAYGDAERHWSVVKAALRQSSQDCTIICSGFGTGGQVAVLTAMRILVLNRRYGLTERTVKVVTFDDYPTFLKDPDSDRHLMRLNHLRFVSGKMPIDGGCTEEMFKSGANEIYIPKDRFAVRLNSARLPKTIDYAMYFSPSDPIVDHPVSVGSLENDIINDLLRISAAHQALAVPIYSATGQLVMSEKAREAATAFAHRLNTQLHARKTFTCQPDAFTSVHRRFMITCRLLETDTVFDFDARLSFSKDMTKRVSEQLESRQNMYECGAPSEQCVLALRKGSQKVRSLLFEAHTVSIDDDRMEAVIASQKPLVMGMQLLESHNQLFTALLTPTDPFPCQCKNLINGVKSANANPKLWALVRSFLRTLPTTDNADSPMFVGKMACKRDSRQFNVKRTSFSLDKWETVRLRMKRVRQCLTTRTPLDCRDPLNHWVRPAQCPKRCLRSSVSLCDNVIVCPISATMNMFVAVESTPFQWINGGWLGRLDGRVKAHKQDRYVAYHVKSLDNGFGWWDLKSEFHLLFSFERH